MQSLQGRKNLQLQYQPKLQDIHQGCAMDVLARIESVNMYWYVWVCILACIWVRIGMYQLGTY